MVNTIILGSISVDDIKTPAGEKSNVLGGSAIYAALACSLFSETGIISIIGEDFPKEKLEFFKSKKIDLSGLQIIGKTFRWKGYYENDMNQAKTLSTELNSLADFKPELPENYQNSEYVFLGNTDPVHQLKIINQLKNPKFIMLDTMNFWINTVKEDLFKLIPKINLLIVNDQEARSLFNEINLRNCAKKALDLGLDSIIIKKGEHGSMLFVKDKIFIVPGYPLDTLVDPTGCGDSFAGTIIGYISKNGYSIKNLKQAMIYATAVSSYNAQEFSTTILENMTHEKLQKRHDEIILLTRLEE